MVINAARSLAMELVGRRPAEGITDPSVAQAELTPALVDSVEALGTGAHSFVSTPITGGPRLMAFLEKTGIRQLDKGLPVMTASQRGEYMDEVVKPNRVHADEVTARLESEGKNPLESARTERIPGFNNENYNRHWMDFVSTLPSLNEVVVCDGWQFSFGTLLEVRSALDRGIPVHDERGGTVDAPRARREVEAAAAEAARHGLDFSKLPLVMSEADPRTGPMSL